MKRTLLLTILSLACASLVFAWSGATGKISGNYVEVRSNDVYVGACYANSEIGLIGKEGTLAWNITSGDYLGAPLRGLSVVAVILANSTLGDKHSSPYPIRSVLIFDERADRRQREALRAFATDSAGKILGTVVREEIAPIRFEQASCAPTGHEAHLGHGVQACVKVTAGSLVTLQTRDIRHTDNVCANAEVFFPPLISGVKGATPVFAMEMVFRGQGLGTQWSIPDKRGGYVAAFELNSRQISER